MPRPLFSRKTDLSLLIFFSLHTFFVLGIDCLGLYPAAVHAYPPFPKLLQLRAFYIDTYQDKFLAATTHDAQQPWFVACTWMELVYHVPTCLWAVYGLYRGNLSFFLSSFSIFPRSYKYNKYQERN